MIKNVLSWFRPVWIYLLVFLIIRILMYVLPKSDFKLIISALAYGHLTAFIYPFGLLLGWIVQSRSCLVSVSFQLILAVIMFLVSLIFFTIFTYYDIRAMIMLDLIPSAVSSCLFFVGELSTKKRQIQEGGLK